MESKAKKETGKKETHEKKEHTKKTAGQEGKVVKASAKKAADWAKVLMARTVPDLRDKANRTDL